MSGGADHKGGPGGSVLAVIPARYASTRFPGKPLAVLAGKPMIQHVVERVGRAAGISRVIVATDDDRILQAVTAFGGEAMLTGDHATGTDRIAEVATREGVTGATEWVLNVQGDEPLIDPADLERLVQGMRATPEAVLGTLVHAIGSEEEFLDPNVVKAVLDAQGRALYFTRAAAPYTRPSQSAPSPAWQGTWRHLGVYLFRADFLHTFTALPATPLSEREQLEQLRALEHGHPIHCFEALTLSPGVDVPEDLERAKALLRGG